MLQRSEPQPAGIKMILRTQQKVFSAANVQLEHIREFVLGFLTSDGVIDEQTIANFVLVIDEACSNVINHGYKPEDHKVLDLDLKEYDDKLEVIIKDTAPPFNPLLERRPDLKKHAQQYRTHGLGIYIITRLIDDISYEYVKDHGNKLTLIQYKPMDAESMA
jgi:anti-sigma regulatory factor (Ser/Thr protein kinase)